MRNLITIIIGIAAAVIYFKFMDPAAGFVVPATAPAKRIDSGIRKYEFTNLFEQNQPFSKLAKKGYYTVIEGYIDTCTICKLLEADFPAFLNTRRDVVIRKVHLPEGGVSQSFSGRTQEELTQQMDAYHQRLGRYNFNHVVKTDTQYQLTTCGTPHVEIYGPDRQLIATDKCGKKNLKTGLIFLRNWIKSESQT
jgi:hypothetical protein